MKRTLPPQTLAVERLLSLYRFSGAVAMASFALFLTLLATVLYRQDVSYALLAMSLFAGFLWLGSTSVCRHSLVRLRDVIGKRVGLLEFLSTQFVFILFPCTYPKVKREVNRYKQKFS
jgi:hypothetical protein